MNRCLNNEFVLSTYVEVASLHHEKNVVLVQNQINGKFFVKKSITRFNKSVYESLKNNPFKNIATIHEILEDSTGLTVFEEFINGETLEELLQNNGSLHEKQVFDIFLQLCDALIHIHGMEPSIIHRDIKLSNVMLSNDGVVKLIDFNTSRNYQEGYGKDTTIMGTAGYAAPEQFGFSQSDERSDIYSMGVLLNYLLTGKHIQEEITRGCFYTIVQRCTNMDPNQRYANVEQLKRAVLSNKGNVRDIKEVISNFSRKLPGFRTHTKWKMVVALLGYGFIYYLSSTVQFEGETGISLMVLRIGFFIMMISLLIVNFNKKIIRDHFPLLKHPNFLVRGVMLVLVNFLVMLCYALILSFF